MLSKKSRNLVPRSIKVSKALSPHWKNYVLLTWTGFYIADSFSYLDERIDSLMEQCACQLQAQGFSRDDITTTPFLNLRYDRTDCALMVTAEEWEGSCRHGDFEQAFTTRLRREMEIFSHFVGMLSSSFIC